MSRTALIAMLLLLATPVQALCVSIPDTSASNYVENGTAHMLCLQREVGRDAELAAERARIDAELGNIRIELERQHQLILQQQTDLSAFD
jgi:hypothetical protein